MKSFKLIPVGAALALFLAASASAYAVTISPAGPVTLTGSTTLTKGITSVSCTANFTGTVSSAGAISISAAKFTGGTLCSGVTPTGLPWTGTVTSTTALKLNNVAVNTLLGACGPSAIVGSITENTTLQETTITLTNQPLSGGCSVTGTLTTSPFLTIK
ncbi:activator protein [Trinickia diaoshuihuensis]|uniref:activator protein n=1 Tax=Trinickia diaoshuihuensis TaxID=2292265 RepID=UPI000E260D88|nr:activator protein [Trinickia diaoshuihuensis]